MYPFIPELRLELVNYKDSFNPFDPDFFRGGRGGRLLLRLKKIN